MSPENAVLWITFGFLLFGWLLYFHERERSRDYASDLAQVIYDHDLGHEDLRRSLEWDEIANRVDRETPDRDRTLLEAGGR